LDGGVHHHRTGLTACIFKPGWAREFQEVLDDGVDMVDFLGNDIEIVLLST
jgi:hypothetical protein